MVARLINDQLDQYTGSVFETICREWVWRSAGTGQLGFSPRAVGSWWDDHEEIDVVAVAGDTVLLGECKWTTRLVGVNVLDDLRRKAQPLVRRQGWKNVTYVLFTRNGFTPALHSVAAEQRIRLLNLEEILA